MKHTLRHIRILLSLLILALSVVWALHSLGAPAPSRIARALQITPCAALSSMGATLTAAIIWLAATFLLGRVYCSTVCPVGTLQDAAIRLRRFLPAKRRRFSYRKPGRRRFIMLALYILSFILAIGCVPLLLEPWPAFVNAISRLTGSGMHPSLAALGTGASMGLICALLSVLLVFMYALFTGREFCNEVCPVGTLLQIPASRSLMHIELYPDKCNACLKCQDVCKASCIDIKSRTVDNARCVRCFNCISVCECDAIIFTSDRATPASPLFQTH